MGTCYPEPVLLKKVLQESSPPGLVGGASVCLDSMFQMGDLSTTSVRSVLKVVSPGSQWLFSSGTGVAHSTVPLFGNLDQTVTGQNI
ncbi:hypothetical protein ILYODFUR_011398 [Ilyodon furcidens]|uniref:Uncharacterized protein n=1 Tax=Ilyodon furcidens TaxID=33524 RepID=A0ABV0SKC4_9TELE